MAVAATRGQTRSRPSAETRSRSWTRHTPGCSGRFRWLTSRRDCLRLEVGAGLGPRLVVTLSNLTVLASRDRDVRLRRAAQSLAVAGGRLWAAVAAAPADTGLTVVRINPTFDSVSRVTRVPIVAAGESASLAARGATVVVAPRSGLLTRIDARDGRTLERRTSTLRRMPSPSGSAARGSPIARRVCFSASTPTAPQRGCRSDAARPPLRSARTPSGSPTRSTIPSSRSTLPRTRRSRRSPWAARRARSRSAAETYGWRTAATAH